MIVAAAICPSPPLLAAELTGQADILPELRAACAAAVARLLAAAPDVVAVVGPAETTGPGTRPASSAWPPLPLPCARPAPSPITARGGPPGRRLPLRRCRSRSASARCCSTRLATPGRGRSTGSPEFEPAAACLALGRRLAVSASRVALLAMGDGSARRSASAPGYLDERAAPFDETVERAVRDGDLPAIAALDPGPRRRPARRRPPGLAGPGRRPGRPGAGEFPRGRPPPGGDPLLRRPAGRRLPRRDHLPAAPVLPAGPDAALSA